MHSARRWASTATRCAAPAAGERLGRWINPLADAAHGASRRLDGASLLGALTLGLFGVGAATPLIGVAYASRQGIARWRGHLLAHTARLKAAFGLVLIAAGVAILSGGDKWREAQLVPLLPNAWIGLTTRY